MKSKKTQALFVVLASSAALILSGCTIYDLKSSKESSAGTSSETPATTSSNPPSSSSSVSSQEEGESSSTSSSSFSSAFSSSSSSSEQTADYEKATTKYTTRSYGDSITAQYLRTSGTQKILVIPVTIKGYETNANATTLSNITKTFTGAASDTGWQSLESFYAASSYGKLNLEVTVAPSWYACGLTAAQITAKNSSDSSAEGVDYLVDHGLAWYKSTYNTNCTDFDQDGDGYIDGIWLVYSAPDYSHVSSLGDTFWAFTSWEYDYDANTSSPVANTYCWASYDFMYDGYGTSKVDAHTFIHETGHMMGLEDYYSYNSGKNFAAPMGCIDMMDYNIIDHDAYSKFAFGWVTPYLIDHAGTLTLHPSESTGECAIIPTSGGWNGSAFDEYMMIEYYTPTGLNESDSTSRYSGTYPLGFSNNGIRIYHVDSRLCLINSSMTGTGYTDKIVSSSTVGTYLANSNTYGNDAYASNKAFNLIQEMDCTSKRNFAKLTDSSSSSFDSSNYIADNTTLFGNGTSFSLASYKASFALGSSSLMNDGSSLPFQVAFSNESDSGVTLTIQAA